MTTVAGLPGASSVSPADEVPVSQDAAGVNTLREMTIAQLAAELAGTGLTAVDGVLDVNAGAGEVTSVVGATGVVTAQQIAMALMTDGLFPAPPVASVAGQTGVVTVTELATALAGTNLTVDGTTGKLDASAGGGGSSTVPVTTIATSGATQTLAFASSTGDKAYDITVSQALTLSLTTASTAGYLQRVNLILRQPTGSAGYSVTLPTNVRYSGGVTPSVNAAQGTITFIQFLTPDGGTTVLGQ
jgi:hypothetical protein